MIRKTVRVVREYEATPNRDIEITKQHEHNLEAAYNQNWGKFWQDSIVIGMIWVGIATVALVIMFLIVVTVHGFPAWATVVLRAKGLMERLVDR